MHDECNTLIFNSVFSKGSWGDVLFVLQQAEDTVKLTGIIYSSISFYLFLSCQSLAFGSYFG